MITDRVTNAASYVDAVEAFGVPRFPSPFPPLYVVSVWRRDKDGDLLQARLRVMAPSGKELFVFPLPEQVLTADIHRHNVGLSGFNLEEPGEHRVLVEHQGAEGWREVGALPFFVELVEATAKSADDPAGAT